MDIKRVIQMDSQGNYPDQRSATPTFSRVTGPGNIAAGASEVTIQNVGNAKGTVLGTEIDAGQSVTFRTAATAGLGAITFDGTGTVLLVTSVALAAAPAFPSYTQDPRGTDPSFTQEYPNGISPGQINVGQNT